MNKKNDCCFFCRFCYKGVFGTPYLCAINQHTKLMIMKSNNSFFGVQTGFFTSIVLLASALNFTACQNDDLNADEEIAHATYTRVKEIRLEREYAQAFAEEFGTPDANHTWMCVPTTITHRTAVTRAMSDNVVSVEHVSSEPYSMKYSQVDAALGFMAEEGDYRGNAAKCTQNFEYLAVETTTYDIYPTFWGRKFCDNNKVGIYYMDGNNRVDLDPFWNDRENHISVVLTDGNKLSITNKDTELTTLIQNAIPKCSTCGGDGLLNDHKCNGNVSWNNNSWRCETCGKSYDLFNHPKKCNATVGDKCTACNGTGKASVDHIEFPHYKVTIPAGVTWGLYLETAIQQNSSTRVKWYSNANFNDGKSPAAASFSFGGIDYVSFEDAPMTCESGQRTGNCSECGHGHYDHDYNDIVLIITPRPIESTYDSQAVRVMCEDLGGSFDWDFNDLVYDILYEEGMQTGANAKATITLRAIGGTLPIYFQYDNNAPINLHADCCGQAIKIDDNGNEVYDPVLSQQKYELATIELPYQTRPEGTNVFADIVKKITLTVADKYYTTTTRAAGESASEGTVVVQDSHEIKFPDPNDKTKVPQCFMTSIGTEWPAELQNIADRYPLFPGWVQNQSQNQDWYKTSY